MKHTSSYMMLCVFLLLQSSFFLFALCTHTVSVPLKYLLFAEKSTDFGLGGCNHHPSCLPNSVD